MSFFFRMKSSILSDFSKVDKISWKKKFEKELNGRSYEDSLFHPAGPISIDPYYVEFELSGQEIYREIQTCQRREPGWLTVPALSFDAPQSTNLAIRHHLDTGADAVLIECKEVTLQHLDLAKLLYTVRLTDTPIFFDSTIPPIDIIQELGQGSGYYLKGGLFYDPLAEWMLTGKSPDMAFDGIAHGMELTKMMREFFSYKVESHLFHEAGADVVQELAFTLSSFVTYLDQLTERGISALLAVNRVLFSFSIGTEYLAEIAKLRAFRYLYRLITRAYGLPDDLCEAKIHCRSSRLYQSIHSPYTNQIRHSSEAMSAVIGGCDALTIAPFDASYAERSEFSGRIALNISLLLKNESLVDKVADPAAGSYFLEKLTKELAEAAWETFSELENEGGLRQAFEKNIIQEKIKRSWNQNVTAYHEGKVMIGVNKFIEGKEDRSVPVTSPNEDLSPSWEFALLYPRSMDEIF